MYDQKKKRETKNSPPNPKLAKEGSAIMLATVSAICTGSDTASNTGALSITVLVFAEASTIGTAD